MPGGIALYGRCSVKAYSICRMGLWNAVEYALLPCIRGGNPQAGVKPGNMNIFCEKHA